MGTRRSVIGAAFVATLLVAGCTAPSRILPADLKPFTTDACSAGFPEGTSAQPKLWCDCCVAHDLAYWKGGTAEERRAADTALRECVTRKGEPATASRMELGVRIGGGPYWPTPFRWAYGWPFYRGYAPLSSDEQRVVDEMVKGYEAALKARCGQ